MNDFDDLDSFAGDYKPDAGKFRGGLDTLANGQYDLEIIDAAVGLANTSPPKRIYTMTLRVMPGVLAIDHVYWLNDQAAMNRLAADMMALGLDSDKWATGGRKLSVEIPASCVKVRGMRFRASKTSNESKTTNKTYHNLTIATRLTAGTGNGQPALPPPPVMAPPSARDVPSEVPF